MSQAEINVLRSLLRGTASGNLALTGGFETEKGWFANGNASVQALAQAVGFTWTWNKSWTIFNAQSATSSNTPVQTTSEDGLFIDPVLAVTPEGIIEIKYDPNTGNSSLYQGTTVQRSTGNALQDFVNDYPPALAYDPTNGDVLVAWIAEGKDSSIPLKDQQEIAGRILVSGYDAGGGWEIPQVINFGKDSQEILKGVNFEPNVHFFYTRIDRTTNVITPVSAGEVDFNNSQYNINRVVVWSYGESAKDLNPNSSATQIQEAFANTDLVYSLSSRSVLSASRWSNWSSPQVIVSQQGSDRTPTLGLDPNGALRLAWVNEQFSAGETQSAIYSTSWDGQKWNNPQTVAQGKDLRVEKLIVENFGNQPAVYWTDDIEPSYHSEVLRDQPVYYYRLNELDQDFALNLGTKGASGDGVYTNPSTSQTSPFSFSQQGALFDRTNRQGDSDTAVKFFSGGYLTIPVDKEDLQNGHTFESWIKLDSVTGERILAESQSLSKYTLALSNATTAQQYNIPSGVLYLVNPSNQVVWQSNNTIPAVQALMQSDGNLVLYKTAQPLDQPGSATEAVWNSGTQNNKDAYLSLANDGGLYLLNSSNQIIKTLNQGSLSPTFSNTTLRSKNELTAKSDFFNSVFTPSGQWSIKTNTNTLSYQIGGKTLTSQALEPSKWYHVAVTYEQNAVDANGNPLTPVASLYIDNQLVKQESVANVNFSDGAVKIGKDFRGSIDEVALYDKVLALDTPPTVDENGNVTAYNPSNSNGISRHYSARYNEPNDSQDSGTFYATYDGQSWGEGTKFQAEQELIPTIPLIERQPVFDLVSLEGLKSDGNADQRLSVTLSNPNQTITKISISGNSKTWLVGGVGEQTIAVIQGKKLVNDEQGDNINHTLMGATETFDLYFHDSSNPNLNQPYQVNFTFADGKTFSQTVNLLPNPSAPYHASSPRRIIGKGFILDNETTELSAINSGQLWQTTDTNLGFAMTSGKFLNNTNSIALSNPSFNNGDGVILLYSPQNFEGEINPNQVPTGGVRIVGSSGEGAGYALVSGDVNGDGITDLIISAPDGDNGNGKVYLIDGSKIIPNSTINLNNLGNTGIVLTGFGSGAKGGRALAVGDLNKDGRADIAIGAPFDNGGKGAVYVRYGVNNFTDTTKKLVFTGTGGRVKDINGRDVTWGSLAGTSLDISTKSINNNDSNPDLVIGAPGYTQSVKFNSLFHNEKAPEVIYNSLLEFSSATPDLTNPYGKNASNTIAMETGRAYVLFGKGSLVNGSTFDASLAESTLKTSNGLILDGASVFHENPRAGFSVNVTGDINNDGFDDVVVGAPNELKNSGVAYVVAGGDFSRFNGRSNPLALAWQSNLTVVGGELNGKTGSVVGDGGDFNKDGVMDLLISSPQAGYGAGQTHLLFGTSANSRNPILSKNSNFIFSLAPGSTNNLISYKDNRLLNTSANINTFAFNGSRPQDLSIPSPNVGDLNGDGIDDLLVSALNGNEVYLAYGKKQLGKEGSLDLGKLQSDQGLVIDPNLTGNGNFVGFAGDINGDGFADMISGGNPLESTVVFGSSSSDLLDLSLTARKQLTIQNPREDLSLKVTSAGDYNGDGLGDLLAWAKDALFLIPGSTDLGLIGTIDYTQTNLLVDFANSDDPEDWSDISQVIPSGDIDRDGFADVVVLNSNNEVFISYGSKDLLPDNFALSNAIASGNSIASGGDINNDGYDDIIISDSSNNNGQVTIFYGNPERTRTGIDGDSKCTHL